MSVRTGRIFVAFALCGAVAFASTDEFGSLRPSAVPYEREYVWPEGKMPNVQPRQIAAKTGERMRLDSRRTITAVRTSTGMRRIQSARLISV